MHRSNDLMRLAGICLISILFCACGNTSTRVNGNKADSLKENAQTATDDDNKYMSFIDSIGALPANVAAFIPAGYFPLDTATGDLNEDGISDMVLALKNKYEDTLSLFNDSPTFKRPLMLLTGNANGSYTLARRNDNAVMANNSSGMVASDPFTGLAIKHGYFSVEHGVAEGAQHWDRIITFKYDKNQKEWFLYKDGGTSYQLNDDPDPDAEVLKKASDEVKTQKDFGIIAFEKYNLCSE